MGTIADKLNTLITNKANIKTALEAKGLTPTDTMSTWSAQINSLRAVGADVVAIEELTYDNTDSGLTATDGQAAVDEVNAKVDAVDVSVNELSTNVNTATASVNELSAKVNTLSTTIGNLDAEDVGALPISGGTLTGALSLNNAGSMFGWKDTHYNSYLTAGTGVDGCRLNVAKKIGDSEHDVELWTYQDGQSTYEQMIHSGNIGNYASKKWTELGQISGASFTLDFDNYSEILVATFNISTASSNLNQPIRTTYLIAKMIPFASPNSISKYTGYITESDVTNTSYKAYVYSSSSSRYLYVGNGLDAIIWGR